MLAASRVLTPPTPSFALPPAAQATGEVDAVVLSMRSVSQSIQALKAEVAKAADGSSGAQEQAVAAADAVAAMEQQVGGVGRAGNA